MISSHVYTACIFVLKLSTCVDDSVWVPFLSHCSVQFTFNRYEQTSAHHWFDDETLSISGGKKLTERKERGGEAGEGAPGPENTSQTERGQHDETELMCRDRRAASAVSVTTATSTIIICCLIKWLYECLGYQVKSGIFLWEARVTYFTLRCLSAVCPPGRLSVID